ncbi:MAG: rRNA maturation RNase YbeY [Gammaproteobacteria bacterium]|nr:rRNA maturation RNase YbeY [Gammaproteobacteria bacterium]
MQLNLEIQRAFDSEVIGLPSDEVITRWAQVCLSDYRETAECVIRLVDTDEAKALNNQYREKDVATNVLSFPMEMPETSGILYIGDLVICLPVIQKEAKEQNKTLEQHFAHMVIHGLLHLLGYDHQTDDEAKKMESLEMTCLSRIGYPSPY